MYLCYCKKLYKMKKKVRSFCLDQWWSFPLCLWQQILVSLVSQTVPLYFRRYPSDWRLSACSSLDTTLDVHLSSYPLALFFTDFLSLLHFARFKAVGGSCLAECLSSKRSVVFLQCYIIYTPAGFCPKYFLSGSGISILEVCPCHFKSLNIRLQTKYVDFCTKLKCLFTRYTLLLVRFLNF